MMPLPRVVPFVHPASVGDEMMHLVRELFPICRSITGRGVRQTLGIIREQVPIFIHEIPTGTPMFDWTAPKEWNIRDAYVKNSRGEKIIDFRKSNLHVLNYSVPVRATVSLQELKQHLFTIPDRPDWVPYRTSYYAENWGFCVSHNQLLSLIDDEYEVVIDSSLEDGYLTFGEYFLEGQTEDEVLISTHICHPSLANDNLSGIAVAVELAKQLSAAKSLKYSYRFLFTPGLIGSIAWLSLNECNVNRIAHGLILACLGDNGDITYKKSRRGDADIDRAVLQVLKDAGAPQRVFDFSPWGYDERQFCSPGFNLPVGCFMRTPHGQYPEYHTSADNLDLIESQALADSLDKCANVLRLLDQNATYMNMNPKCEPQLGRRGLYSSIGGATESKQREMAMLWVLNFSDGEHSLLDVAEKSGLKFETVKSAADALEQCGLLKRINS